MSEIRVDTISEKTSANGVAVDGVTLKDGGIAATAASTITTADNLDTLSLVSTDADANIGPVLNLYRNSSSPATDDVLGAIKFSGENSADEVVEYFRLEAAIQDKTDGSEDFNFKFKGLVNGAEKSFFEGSSGTLVFNNDSVDMDFRVESNGNANMFVVDGGLDVAAIGGAADTNATLLIHTTITDDNTGLTIKGAGSGTGARLAIADAGSNLGTRAETLEIGYDNSTDFIFSRTGQDLLIGVNSSEVARFTASGLAIGGTGAANTLGDYEEGTYTPTVTCSNSGSYGLASGGDLLQYTKIGRKVTIQGMISVTSESSPSGALMLSLPFTAPALTDDSDFALYAMGISNNGSTIAGQKFLFLQPGSHAYLFAIGDDGATNYIGEDEVDTNFQFHVNLSYVVS